jgi:putative membrane-bound dehydrogenase-like protein
MRGRRVIGGLALALAGLLPAWPQGLSPQDAAGRMRVPEGFAARLVAAEPLVRQPVAIDFDDRGRLWVLQYLQYPNPAGLKRVKVDRYSRTVYDRVPEPPPRGPKGNDRVTILEDTDGDGRMDRARDFVAGLNLSTGFAFGHGGVFVLQVPYLLFYPDRDGDDVPDGDPDVLLSGFGMEDTSGVANSLTWGPDGFLYGCQGTNVSSSVRGIEFQQGIWRYHPLTHRFELFAEGGGNCWGMDFDRHGNLLVSTNVGGFTALHAVQGGYYWKQFGKHGDLHNPHAYGFFDHVPHRNFRGGHVTVGGIVYRGDSFPERFRGKFIAADLLGHAVYWHELEPSGSTFRSAHGGELLLANDAWFAPTDVTLGPEGSVYVADWYDKRTAHPDPDADWDRSNGRVYKIEARGTRPYSGEDLRKLPSGKLVALLSHRNDWLVRKARRILADRRDPEVILPLRTLVLESPDDEAALQSLWALHVSGGFSEGFALRALGHRSPDVRAWAVRLLGDDNRVSSEVGERLRQMAVAEPDVRVRCQLASTARRLPAADALDLVERLALREDALDPYLPLLLWWALEPQALPARERVLFFTSEKAWQVALIRDYLLGRLMRRYAAAGTETGEDACAAILTSAPPTERGRMLAALDQGLQDRAAAPARLGVGTLLTDFASDAKAFREPIRVEKISPRLMKQLVSLGDESTDPTVVRLLVRIGHRPAQEKALALACNTRAVVEKRLAMLGILGEVGSAGCVESLLGLVGGKEPEAIQSAALDALRRFDVAAVGDTLLHVYPRLTPRLRSRAREVLLGRRDSALAFLRAVDRGQVAAAEVPADQLRPLSLFKDRRLDDLVRKHWGSVRAGTPEEKLAEVRRLSNDLRAGGGDPRAGREVYRKVCAACHRLFEEGERIGPDLTHANRKDRDYLLVSIVDPGAVVRKEYLHYVVQTTDGRALTGLIAEQTPAAVTLVDSNKQRVNIPRNKIEAIEESPTSFMPEGLLKDLRPQELRDLFGYLQSDRPLPPK